jgi:hypothetical protein
LFKVSQAKTHILSSSLFDSLSELISEEFFDELFSLCDVFSSVKEYFAFSKSFFLIFDSFSSKNFLVSQINGAIYSNFSIKNSVSLFLKSTKLYSLFLSKRYFSDIHLQELFGRFSLIFETSNYNLSYFLLSQLIRSLKEIPFFDENFLMRLSLLKESSDVIIRKESKRLLKHFLIIQKNHDYA